MSNYYTERFLEDKYEQGLDEGMTVKQAEKYARECLENKWDEEWISL
tara:strand:+ start:135 stop:275 length:141 start_codon:yes stop_codon:yes gene_type:complete